MVGITRSKVIADVLQALKIGKMFEGFRRLVFPAFDFKTSILSKAAEKGNRRMIQVIRSIYIYVCV
jgi:hypothetical protein